MLVSDNTGTAASALDAYREQLKGMTAERLKFEQASVSANLQHVAGGDMLNGSAYKNIMSEVVPMALFDGNAARSDGFTFADEHRQRHARGT